MQWRQFPSQVRHSHVAVQGDCYWRNTMKKMILSALLTAAVSSSAFAQATPMMTQQGPDVAAHRTVRGTAAGHYARYGAVHQEYAPGVLIDGNHYAGQDPDPNVRLQLRRDPVSDY
jgi:hypothetical protein